MNNKKFGLLSVLNLLVITALVLAACSKATPTAAPAQATQAPSAALPTSLPATAPPTSAPAVLATSSSANPTAPDYWPAQDWRSSTPEQQGMDSAQISKVFDAIQKAIQLVHSLIIVRNGTIVTEAYFAPFRADARHNLNSTTISVVSILIGIAIQQGYINGLDQKMLDFFPDRKIANPDARKQAITIRDLLSMTSGLREDDSGKDGSADWVQYVLDLPMENDPGKVWNPNGGGYHLLSAIIQKTTGMTPLAFAIKVLFEPLGISGAGWLTDPQGINNGSGLMYLTSRDMAKIGYLYLNNGEWNGKQIVPKEYVLASTKHLFDVYRSHSGWGYGYGWLIAPDGSYLTEGNYGQVIDVKPEQGIVTVFTGGTSEDFSLNEEDLVDQLIVPAVKSAGPLPENKASTALLNDQITALEKPAPGPILALPKIAQTISAKKYLLEDGEAFKLTFAGDQATLDWSFKDQSMKFPIGMDNVYRATPFEQTEMTSLFGGTEQRLGHVFLALRGSWTAIDTFELTMQNLDSSRHHTVIFKFAEDKVNTIQSETINGDIVSLQGQVQGPSSTTTTPTPPVLAKSTVTQVVLGVIKGRIAFYSNRDGNNEIYVMNGDGSGLTNLTDNPADDIGPVWSPDGKKIIFLSNRDGNTEIYVMNADGSHQTNLTNNPANDGSGSPENLDWSPDGKKIAFATDRDGNWEIYVMNADGSAQTNLTHNPASDDYFPKWSADGKQIGFTTGRDGNDEIYLMSADGSNQTRLTHNSGDDAFLRWSPDGKKIVFVSGHGDGHYEIYLMKADGSNQTKLTDSPGSHDDNMGARWSPDGMQIIFYSTRDGNQELYVMNADGSNQTRLTNNPANDSAPMLQP